MRAPTEDRGLLFDPGAGGFRETVAANGRAITGDIGGVPFAELRSAARQKYGVLAGDDPGDRGLVLSGHQPEFFHPGVWAKNFAAAWAGRAVGTTAGHVVIDSDLAAATTLTVPTEVDGRLDESRLAFDASGPAPWEERRVIDGSALRDFPDRSAAALQPFGFAPLVADRESRAILSRAAGDRGVRLDAVTTSLRTHFERRWGIDTPQVRLSDLEAGVAFERLLAHLVTTGETFAAAYNEALAAYRRRHGLRRAGRPVPDLETGATYIELPVWVWRRGATFRKRLSVGRVGDGIRLLADGAALHDTPLDNDADAVAEAIATLREQGVRFRSRALLTTLFLRLFIADIFIHGIGGALYDEVTDELIRRFFAVDPPRFAAVSATLRLPLGGRHELGSDEARTRLRADLIAARRRLEFDPARYFDVATAGPRVTELMQTRRRLIAEQKRAEDRRGLTRSERRGLTPANRRRHDRLAEVEADLRNLMPDYEARLARIERGLADLDRADREAVVVKDREYAFPLFPEDKIGPFMQELAERGAIKS